MPGLQTGTQAGRWNLTRSCTTARNSAMSQKSDTPDGYWFKVIATHVVERTLYTLSTCCDIQTNKTEASVSNRLLYRSYLRLSHINEIIVPVPIAQCTVSDYR